MTIASATIVGSRTRTRTSRHRDPRRDADPTARKYARDTPPPEREVDGRRGRLGRLRNLLRAALPAAVASSVATSAAFASAGTPAATSHGMSQELSAWDDVRRLADELELQIHLASMDARDRWHALEPRLEKLEQQIVHSGERAGDAIVHELHEVKDALTALRDDVYAHTRDSFSHGW
jgi:hypothetical protein